MVAERHCGDLGKHGGWGALQTMQVNVLAGGSVVNVVWYEIL